jgi:23S rRNA (guanosine2251-2'-O)-methyltransferase
VTLGGEQVEGRQPVRELLRAGRRPVHGITVADGNVESGALGDILALARAAGVPLRRVPRTELEKMAATDAPQGVVARAGPLPEVSLDTLARAEPRPDAQLDTQTHPRPPFLVVLDGITDPHNLGAIMRSALSAGATGLVTGRHRAAPLTPAALKAAAGAAEYLPVALVPGVPSALSTLASAGVWTVAVDATAATPVWDLGVATEPLALVLGAEGRGLGRLVRQRCELAVRIPTYGPLASLNVAAAAVLACFEVARLRNPTP